MKKRFITISIVLVGLGLLLTSCEKFLDQAPDDRTQLKDLTTIKELLTSGYAEYSFVPIFELRSDNLQDKGFQAGSADATEKEIYEWAETVQSTYQDSPQGFWSSMYNGVAVANQALQALDEISVTPAEQQALEESRGEALVLRAYNLYMLAQTFTTPYDPKTAATTLGLPYPIEPENVLIKQYERGTLEEFYKKLVDDFEKGIKIIGSTYNQPKFHFTPTSAAAFGTRLYRTLGQWDKVIQYGKQVLGSHPELLLRKVNSYYPKLGYYEQRSTWGSDAEDCNLLTQVVISNWVRSFIGRYGIDIHLRNYIREPNPEKEVPNNFMGKRVPLPFYGGELWANIPKIHEFFKYTNITTGTGYVYSQFVLLSAEEVLFNLAEAYVMTGQFSEAEKLLQHYMSRWLESYKEADDFKVTKEKIVKFYTGKTGKVTKDPVFGKEITTFNPFFEVTQEQEMYLRAILYWRQVTFLHEGLRWLDNRQYRMDIIHNRLSDNDTKEEFLVLRGDSPRYPFQLPSNVLPYLEKNSGYETPVEILPNE